MFYLQEEFKPMIDESGIVNRYIISNYGRVYDIKNDCFVSQVLTGKPQYFYVNYTNDEGKRKLRRVHNLLARTWLTNNNPTQYCIVDHIDKNKYNNCIDNLRWTDRIGNANNMSSNIMVGDSVLTNYCRDKYKDNYITAVAYISRTIREQNVPSEQAIAIYDNYLYNLSTQHDLFIEHKGQQVRLKDYCEELNIDYKSRKQLYIQGESEFTVKLGAAPYTGGYEYKYNDSVSIWSPTKYMQGSKYQVNRKPEIIELIIKYSYEDYLRVKHSYTNSIDYKGKLYMTYQLLELKGRTSAWYKDVKKRHPTKTFEEILELPYLRINKYTINGKTKTRKEWCLYFNLNPKLVGTRMSHKNLDFKTTLESYGVDTSNMTVLPLT